MGRDTAKGQLGTTEGKLPMTPLGTEERNRNGARIVEL